ncbi:MAG TPA: hypothetical protein VLR46_11065, partial [Candidatus Dormibacteraeota bacterium]|nr:hypothetical protein [Candidatus Dormibacteraeota bacterium]
MTSIGAFLLSALMLVPALLIAIPVHEMGHAAAAYIQGDRSVRYFGYFTLNPRRFLDPLGAIAVFVALVGWGRKAPARERGPPVSFRIEREAHGGRILARQFASRHRNPIR